MTSTIPCREDPARYPCLPLVQHLMTRNHLLTPSQNGDRKVMTMKRCPNCKKSKVVNRKTEVTETVAGHVFRAMVPAEVCGACGEAWYAAGVIDRLHLLVANQLALAGLDAGDVIKYMRKAAGVAAGDLAKMLNVRPETVSRW